MGKPDSKSNTLQPSSHSWARHLRKAKRVFHKAVRRAWRDILKER